MSDNNNQNQSNSSNNAQDDMIFLPESPDTPSFGPPAGVNEPAAPEETPEGALPTGPLTPGNGQRPPIAVYPIPIIPRPEPDTEEQSYCTVRFFHAAVGYGMLNVYIGNKPVVNQLQYGEVSSYFVEPDEFKTINVVTPKGRRALIASETFFFGEEEVYTVAFVNGLNGLCIYMIPDVSCMIKRPERACVRAVNLSYNTPPLDMTVQNGMVRFEDLRFKTVSAYKQIQQGVQEFYVTEALSGAYVFRMTQETGAGKMYTVYIIGDAYGSPDMTGVFTEDYSLLSDQ